MEQYKNLGGSSAVSAYENGSDFIRVKFNDGSIYLYTYESAGQGNIEHMMRLAIQGQGLCTYINKAVRKAYACKEQ